MLRFHPKTRYMQPFYVRTTVFLLPAGLLVSQNLIPNPGFEVGAGDDFNNWSKLNGADFLTASSGGYS